MGDYDSLGNGTGYDHPVFHPVACGHFEHTVPVVQYHYWYFDYCGFDCRGFIHFGIRHDFRFVRNFRFSYGNTKPRMESDYG